MLELLTGLDRTRYTPSLITCIDHDQLGYALTDIPVRRLSAKFPSVAALRELELLVRELNTDILHAYMGLHNSAARWVRHRGAARAVVTSVRCTQLPLVHILGDRWTHDWGDALIVNSVGIQRELERRARIPATRIDVVENGVDLERFHPLDEVTMARERRMWGLEHLRVLVMPGRLSRQKNQWNVIRAIAKLKSAGKWPADVRVVFAGRGSPPWMESGLRSMAHGFGITPAELEFAGVVREIERLVGLADGILLPSHFEGLPNAVLEGMASGVPAIVSPAANVDQLVTDGVEGVVCTSTSASAISTALERFFLLSPEQCRSMGSNARAHAERRFSTERMITRTTAIYDRVVDLDAPVGKVG